MKGRSIKRHISFGAIIALFVLWAIMPANAATQEKIDTAIETGVAWLVNQQQPSGSFLSYEPVAGTGFAVTKFCDLAIEQGYDPLDKGFKYHDALVNGLNFLFASASTETINGKNVVSWGPEYIYSTSIATMAIASTNAPDEVVNKPGSAVDGKTYKEVVQLALNYLEVSQRADGGWRYDLESPLEESDNSNTGYAVLALIYAQNRLGLTIPDGVLSGIKNFVGVIQDTDGSSKYTPSKSLPNILKTGNLLYEMKVAGYSADDPRVLHAISYIENNWNNPSPDPGWKQNYQAMYTAMKGFEAYKIDRINVGGVETDWFDDLSTYIVNTQLADGSWPQDYWGDNILATEWALLTLEKVVEPPENEVYIDIKPGLCPNLFNPCVKGEIPIAILGTESLDVRNIDTDTVKLSYNGNYLSPVGWSYQDVATPFKGKICNCHALGSDGRLDLNLRFNIQQMNDVLKLPCSGDIPLTISCNLKKDLGASEIEGQDCIQIPPPCGRCSETSPPAEVSDRSITSGCRRCNADLNRPIVTDINTTTDEVGLHNETIDS